MVAIVLALMASVAYGSSDFAAGLASRRVAPESVAGVVQAVGVLTAICAVAVFPGAGPSMSAVGWGAISGVGSAVALLSLFRGMAVAPISVVATVSAVLVAVVPAIVGVALLGDHLTIAADVGIAIAIPALALVCWQPGSGDRNGGSAGLLYGGVAGLGFALLFIALARAGTKAGAWPLVPSQLASLLLVAPFAYRSFIASPTRPSPPTTALALGAGLLAGFGNMLFLAATGRAQLAIVAVLTALYPAVTVLLARMVLTEKWTLPQAVGLLTAAAAIVLISAH
jgi:drug/metabolite transporter (DMT)-like permease